MFSYLSTTSQKIQDMLEHGYEKNDTFKDARESIAQVGASAYHLISVFAIAVIAIAFVIATIKLSNGDPRSRSEGKERMIRAFIAGACVFGTLAIIDFIAYLVQSSLVG